MTNNERLQKIAEETFNYQDDPVLLNVARPSFEAGGLYVTLNPNQFGLYSEEQVNQMMTMARISATQIPTLGNKEIISNYKKRNK